MAKKRKAKPPKPRRTWDRNPVERPHSTPKGKRGYNRNRDKQDWETEREQPSNGE